MLMNYTIIGTMDKICLVLFVVYFLYNNVDPTHLGNPELGQLCTRDNITGICKLITDCPHDQDYILKAEKFDDCESNGTQVVICCSLSNRKPGDISKLKCAEYSKLVRVIVRDPTLIIGGRPTQKIICSFRITQQVISEDPSGSFEFPHMALLNLTGESSDRLVICGGSLISDQHVLTAAHCISPTLSKVVLGINKLNKTTKYTQYFSVIETKLLRNYNSLYHYNDIAILKLDRKVKLSPQVRPACLYFDQDDNKLETAIVTGWGAREGYAHEVSDNLMKAVVGIVPTTRCNESYRRISKLPYGVNVKSQICAGTYRGEEPKDTCDGDSGSPLQIYSTEREYYCTYKIFGITSFGHPDCGAAPGVYTRVPAFLKEIEDIVWPPS